MKKLAVLLTFFVVSGCSMTPKVGDRSDADYPIALKSNSSPALIALSKTPIKGVRDLSLDEFEDAEDEVKKFEALDASVNGDPLNPNAYAVGSVAVGASLGLGLDYVSGVALLGRLAADNRPENFDFSDDFLSDAFIYSPISTIKLRDNLNKFVLGAVVKTDTLIESVLPIDRNKDIPAKYSYNESNGIDNHHSFKNSKLSESESKLLISFATSCKHNISLSLCSVRIKVSIDKKETALISLLIENIAKSLPKGSLIYLPPRKDLNRIPMVYNSDGEVMYLVEQK